VKLRLTLCQVESHLSEMLFLSHVFNFKMMTVSSGLKNSVFHESTATSQGSEAPQGHRLVSRDLPGHTETGVTMLW
jgi:hypothetical protein